MIHPFAPFITEELYLALPTHLESIMLEKFVSTRELPSVDLSEVEVLYKMISDIRNYKVTNKIAPNQKLDFEIETNKELFTSFEEYFSRFAFANKLSIVKSSSSKGIKFVYTDFTLYIEDGVSDEEKEAKKAKDIAYLESEIDRCKKMLSNPNFVNKAPKEKVDLERNKLSELEAKLANLK